MALSGTLDTVPAAELLQFLGLGRKTGTLTVRSCGSQRGLVLENGVVVSSYSDHPAQFLGEQLMRLGLVDGSTLQLARRQAEASHRPLGLVLLELGALEGERLREILVEKAIDATRDIFDWRRGTFAFVEGRVLDEGTPRLAFEAQSLLLEVAYRIDQWEVLRAEFPDDDVTVCQNADPILAEVDCEDARLVLGSISPDGVPIAALCRRVHRPAFWVYQKLYELQRAGQLRVMRSTTDRKKAREEAQPQTLSPAEAARQIGVSVGAVHRWIRDGVLPVEESAPGAPYRVFLSDELCRRLREGVVPDGWVPMEEAARRLGTTREHVAFLVARGRLRAMRATVGARRLWTIDLTDLADLAPLVAATRAQS